jgi:type VII secretion protein EccE
MARRKGKSPRKTPLPPPRRTAGPRRDLVALSPRSGAIASVLATAGTMGTVAAGLAPAASAAVAATVIGAFGAQFNGRTLGEWIKLRRNTSDLPEQAALFSRDGIGIVFDGRTASACVEVTPRPWQLTTITAAGASESPTITADHLRRQLDQYGVRCSRITAICAGYKFAARDGAAGVLDTLIGPVSAPLGGTTVIVVSMDLDADALGQSYRRARKETVSGKPSLPDGLCRTLTLAATRVCHSLSENGFGGKLMSAQRLRGFHDAVLAQVASSLSDPHWNTCGPSNGVHTRTYTPARGYWNSKAAGAWHHLQSHRQFTTLTLTPQGQSEALAQPLITYLVNSEDALSRASGYGLRPAVGQQVAGLSQALPVAAGMPLRTTGAIIDDNRQLGFGIPAGGAGMFVGSRADKTRVFVAVTPGEEPLWLCGPKLFALQMVARLSTQDLRIAVMVEDRAWKHVIDHRRTPALTAGTLGSAPVDAVVCTPQWWELNRDKCLGKAVIVLSEEDPGRLITNSLAVFTAEDGTSQIEVNVDSQSTVVSWELTPLERRTLLGDVDVDLAGDAPSEGADLNLSELVHLPVAPPRRRPRRAASVSMVPTVAPINAETMAQVVLPPVPRRKVRPARLRTRQPEHTENGIPFAPAAQVSEADIPAPRQKPRTKPRRAPMAEPPLEGIPFVPQADVPAAAPRVRPTVPAASAIEFAPRSEVSVGVSRRMESSPAAGGIEFVPQVEVPVAVSVDESVYLNGDSTEMIIQYESAPESPVDAPVRPPGRHRRRDSEEGW